MNTPMQYQQLIEQCHHDEPTLDTIALFICLFCRENGYLTPTLLLKILLDDECYIHITATHCNLLFHDDKRQYHMVLSSPLYYALLCIQQRHDFRQVLRATTTKQLERSSFHMLKGMFPYVHNRTFKALVNSTSVMFATTQFTTLRGDLEKQQALSIERYQALTQEQSVKKLAQPSNNNTLLPGPLNSRQKNTSIAHFTASEDMNQKAEIMLNKVIKLLRPRVYKNKQTVKQFHTVHTRKPLIKIIDEAMNEITAHDNGSCFHICALTLIKDYLVNGNKRPFLSISSIRNYIDVFNKLDSHLFNQAVADGELMHYLHQTVRRNHFNLISIEQMSYSIKKLAVLFSDLNIADCVFKKDKLVVYAKAEYITYTEFLAVIYRIQHVAKHLNLQQIYGQIFAVLMGYFGGLRRMEVLCIRHQDIKIEPRETHHRITVRIKNTSEYQTKHQSSRTLYLYIPTEAQQLLSDTLQVLTVRAHQPSDAVLNINELSISQRNTLFIDPVSAHLKLVTHDKVVFHSLRHSFAMNTLMQYRASMDIESFALPSMMMNSRALFIDSLLEKFDCLSAEEACEITRKFLGHAYFTTTLCTYLQGSAFYYLFSPELNNVSITRKVLVSMMQKDRAFKANSFTEKRITQLIKRKQLIPHDVDRQYKIDTHSLQILFTQHNVKKEMQYKLGSTRPKANHNNVNMVIPLIHYIKQHPSIDIIDFTIGELLLHQHQALTQEKQGLSSTVNRYQTVLQSFLEQDVSVGSLKLKQKWYLRDYFSLLSNAPKTLKGARVLSSKGIDRHIRRNIEKALKQSRLWRFTNTTKYFTRPPKYSHVINDDALHIIIKFLKGK